MIQKRKMFFRMITASLLRRRSRMLIALLAIAVGSTILSGLMTIYFDVPRQMGAQFRNYGANMIFTPNGEYFSGEDLEAAVEKITANELVGATPYSYANLRMRDLPVLGAGTNFESAYKTSPYWLVEGEWPDESGEILIGATVAGNFALKAGDKISVTFTPEDKTEMDRYVDCTVTGILSTGGSEEDYIYLSMEDLVTLTERADAIDIAEISISTNGEGLNKYIEKINSSTDALTASLVKRVTASETTVLSKLQALVFLVTVVVLALTMICVATTMMAVVSERRSEIGLRKAIGASDSSLIKEFMGEGILLGALGGLLGAGVGFCFAQVVSYNVFSSYITFRPLLIPITIAASIVVTGIACLIPIKNATRIEPALVLKGE